MKSVAFSIATALSVSACAIPYELLDTESCLELLGTANLSSYQSNEVTIPSRYGRSASVPIFLPTYSSWPLGLPNASIRRAVIYQHGLSGDANSYFCAGMANALESQSTLGETLVISPWFGNVSVTGTCWGGGDTANRASMFFNTADWLQGGNNSPGPDGTNPPTRFGTSFDGLDALIAILFNQTAFPTLERVVLVGFSAGAQLAQHYAWAARSLPTSVTVVVSDPSSFLYFSPGRPAPVCRPLSDSGVNATCNSWVVPDAGQCPE